MSRAEIALKYFEQQKNETDARVREGIEKYRKGDAVIEFVSEGKLPDSIVVEAEQTGHEFRFGANLFMLDEFECEEKNILYRQSFPQVFNLATLPFYWSSLEPERGKFRYAKDCERIYRRPSIDLCLEYCAEKGIEPKAHCLNYDYFKPGWLYGASVEEHKRALEEHFADLSARYADIIPSWEVTNETFNLTFAKKFLDENNYSLFYREKDFNEWSFKTAEKYFPKNRLIINDHLDFGCMRSLHGEFFGERSPYFLEIERIMNNGVSHLDSVGFQYHCFFAPEMEKELNATRYNPGHIFDVLDTYEKLGKRLQITEMTVSAFSESEEDEWVQAELLKNYYSIFFSHRAMEAVIYWNLVDGYAAGAQGQMENGENKYRGGLLHFDMSEKPAYRMLKELINKEWHTHITAKAVDGRVTFRGFYGDYSLKIIADGREIPASFRLSHNEQGKLTVRL